MPTPFYWKKKVILLKAETVYGTDIVPTGALNAILARNVTFNENPTTGQPRDLVKPTLGNVVEPQTLRKVELTFDVEMAGSGAVDTPPAYGPGLRACGLAETINALVDVQYDPVSAAYESASAYINIDGVLHKMLGVRGSVSLVIEPNAVPLFRLTLQGLHVDPTTVALPAAVFTAFKDPLPVSNVNTPTFTLHGTASILRSLTLDLAQTVVHQDLIGAEDIQITGRNPRGSVVMRMPPLATKDWFAAGKAETLGALQLIHGTVAGAIVQIDAPAIQLINPRRNIVDDVVFIEADLNITEVAGDDELKITTR